MPLAQTALLTRLGLVAAASRPGEFTD